MGKINKEWHEAHPMPKTPSADQRVAWHLDHVAHCGCRRIPAGLLALMQQRGISPPTVPSQHT
jgi:hypothetical protein